MKLLFELFSRNMRSIIGFQVVILSFVFLFILCYHKVPVENATIINVAAGLVLAALGGVIGYYFGSSKDSTDKSKADIAQSNSSAIETTVIKDKNQPEPQDVEKS